MITALREECLDPFFQYLQKHISENGLNGTPPFLPLTSLQSTLSDGIRSKFTEGLRKSFGEDGWRRTWIAMDEAHNVQGHIDLRSNGQLNATHRVVLGMGVDSNSRRQNIGFALLAHIVAYCQADPRISWIDLDVLATNTKARRLYDKIGFTQVGKTEDMFRLDGSSYDHIHMTLNVGTKATEQA